LRDTHNYLLELLKDILESDQYERGHSNILEFIMFDFKWARYQLNNCGFIQEQAKNLINSETKLTSANLNKLNSLIRINSDNALLLKSQPNLIERWILSCSIEQAYPIANLLNTLHNEKFDDLKSGTSLFDHLLNMIMAADIKDWSKISHLINRMCLLLNKTDRQSISEKLIQSGFSVKISGYMAGIACYHFSNVVSEFQVINREWSENQIAGNIEGIIHLLNTDFSNALDYFKELMDHYFGLIGAILGFYDPSPNVIKHGREIARRLDENVVVQEFKDVNATGVQRYSDILVFLALYDEGKLKRISDKFDYARLEYLFQDLSKIDHYHRALISILRNTDSQNWKKHVSWIMNKLDYVERSFFTWEPNLALESIKSGAKYQIKIHMCRDCKNELIILKGIYDQEGGELAKRIVKENKDTLAKAISTKSYLISKTIKEMSLVN